MESIATTAAIIALPTFLTEVIELGQGIEHSLNQVIFDIPPWLMVTGMFDF
jgi:hypothetical protein